MASYYAQIDVSINETKTIVRKTVPKTSVPGGKVSISDPKQKTKINTKLLTTSIAIGAYANGVIGSYTGNKHSQNNINSMLGVAGVGVLAINNPVLALSSVAGYTIKRLTDVTIEQKNSSQESEYRRSYLGNMTTSGSRWRGGN